MRIHLASVDLSSSAVEKSEAHLETNDKSIALGPVHLNSYDVEAIAVHKI